MKILFLEDDKEAVVLMVRLLEHSGFKFNYVHAYNKKDFIKEMSSADVLIVDCSLPNFSCEDALLLWHNTGEQQPFIIVSGTISDMKGVILQDIGASAFVSKGSPGLLCDAIKKVLKEYTQEEGVEK